MPSRRGLPLGEGVLQSREQAFGVRPGDCRRRQPHHHVHRREAAALPERLPDDPLRSVSVHGALEDALGDDQAEPGSGRFARAHGGDEGTAPQTKRRRAQHGVELALRQKPAVAPEAKRRRQRHRCARHRSSRRRDLDREPLAALGAAGFEDLAPVPGGHPRPEPVTPLSLDHAGLVRPFHAASYAVPDRSNRVGRGAGLWLRHGRLSMRNLLHVGNIVVVIWRLAYGAMGD